jgi:hypothetical protein
MSESVKQSLLSVLRTMLGFGAGILVARGLLTETEAMELVGAAMVIFPLVWGILNKLRTEEKAQARETVAVEATVRAVKNQANLTVITPAVSQAIIKDYAP